MPKKATKMATVKQATVFVLVETWSRDCENEGSPTVTVFSNIQAAQKMLLEVVKRDNKTGLTETIDDEDEKWEITQTPDWYYAWNEGRNTWVDFTIMEKPVCDT